MSVERSEHDNKYDRQMRLWGGHGQKKLEHADVCCLGSGPTASETLKNLVLPNIGKFTLVDDAITTAADTGNNFFVEQSSIGKPRAAVVTELLLEMNPGVKGEAVLRAPAEVAEKEPEFFKQFTLVIASCLPQEMVRRVAGICQEANVPFLALRSYGLLGYARLQLAEHTIVESHYDNDRFDLFCHPAQLALFPELQAFVDSFDLDKLDSYEHSHVPYVVLLAKAIRTWQQQNDGKAPSSYKEKQAFKDQLMRGANTDGESEVNFEEAKQFAFRAYDQPKLDHFGEAVLNDAKISNLDKDSTPFWVMAAALKRFIQGQGQGCLPCNTNIPDMTSETKHYIQLKHIYAAKSDTDLQAVTGHMADIIKECGVDPAAVTPQYAAYFVKHCRGLQVVRTRSIEEELDPKTFNKAEIEEILEEWVETDPDEERPMPRDVYWYFALRSAEDFFKKHARYPGVGGDPEADAKEMEALQATLLQELGTSSAVVQSDCLKEMARFGATEIHNIAAFMGGIGAQISLKVILEQYVPLNNTIIFNGLRGSCQTMKM